MSDFTSEILEEVLTACNSGAGEAGAALSRTLDAQITLAVGESVTLKPNALPEDFGGPGLAILFMVGSAAAALVLPESSTLVPPWCAAPDATGESKLATLAQELGMNLLPEAFMPEDFKTARVDDLAAALVRGGMSENAAAIALNLSTPEGKRGTARLIWPLAKPSMMIEAALEAKPEPKPAAASQGAVEHKPQPRPAQVKSPSIRALPNYAKSLLKIRVPVVVTLAEKKQSLGQIVEMGPGMIIQFEKSCEEMLELEVGDRKIAAGEAVKVGDKFGIRIASIVLPEERFKPVKPNKRLA
ncbi:MAG: FliM/FliN family flagellar motor switch protein [Pirellulales bacterium]|nr:FliM/FliN family flagellar motor switch protein [Pirellulales bacterium]